MADDFTDSALVLVAHGSTQNADSAKPANQHADELRARRLFADVRTGFLKQQPEIGAVLQGIKAGRIFVVPLFISEGYYTGEVLPRKLSLLTDDDGVFARIRKTGGQTLHYCGPVGTHTSMTDALLARATNVLDRPPFPHRPPTRDTPVVIAGHGPPQNEISRTAVEQQAS